MFNSFCQVKMVKKAFDAQRELIVLASKCQKPSTVSLTTTQMCHSSSEQKVKIADLALLCQSM